MRLFTRRGSDRTDRNPAIAAAAAKLRAKSFAPTQMGDAGPCGGGRCGRDFHDAANDLHRIKKGRPIAAPML